MSKAPYKYKLEPGQKYNKLTVVAKALHGYVCLCDCGTRVVRSGAHLASGRLKSCGCSWREKTRTRASESFRPNFAAPPATRTYPLTPQEEAAIDLATAWPGVAVAEEA